MAEVDDSGSRRLLSNLREEITSGRLAGGDRLPPVRVLAADAGVSVATAGRVLEQLQADGLVVSRRGAGTFVRQFRPIQRSSPSRLSRRRWGGGKAIHDADTPGRPQVVSVWTGEGEPPEWAAGPLGVVAGQVAAYRTREYAVDGRPVQTATSWLPADLVRGTPIMHSDPGPGGIYARLREAGHGPVLFTEFVRTRMPRPDETDKLGLPDGTPVFEITRHAYAKRQQVVEVNRMILAGDAYLLDYTFRPEEG